MNNKEPNEIIINQDLLEALKITSSEFKDNLTTSTKMYHDVIKLVITLSTSILLVSISLIDRILPLNMAPQFIRNTLVLGWVLFFISIIFGIITELKGAAFFGKMAKDREGALKEYLSEISNGQFRKKAINLKERFIAYDSLIWGLTEICSFIFAILCVALYAFGNICSLTIYHIIAIMSLMAIFLGSLIIMYFKNR